MTPTIQKVAPVWGQTLKPGYCAFTLPSQGFDFVGDGIGYFERFEATGGLPFCHALAICEADVAPNDANIIEAHARTGVHRAKISEYFAGSASGHACPVFVRVPRGYDDLLAKRIVAGMEAQLGDTYGYGLIVADLLANTEAGHLINKLTGNVPDRVVCKLFSNAHTRICSQAVACALQGAMPEGYFLPGCLKQAADTIDPKLLGNDPEIWEPVIYQIA